MPRIAIISCYLLALSSCQFNWGHHFVIENELGYDIDSIKVVIGEEANWLYPNEGEFVDNLTVPKSWDPQPVEIYLYRDGNEQVLAADSFNCYNCGGYHMYILKEPVAKYVFRK